jgi:hypothetical protein
LLAILKLGSLIDRSGWKPELLSRLMQMPYRYRRRLKPNACVSRANEQNLSIQFYGTNTASPN